MNTYLDHYLVYLRIEKACSPLTLRNYSSGLEKLIQFFKSKKYQK